MDDILKTLNPEQYLAATYTKTNSCIIACAGSGKTRVLTTKVAYLLNNGIRPSEILLISFTKKASDEMKNRVHKIIKKDLSNLLVGTFHSIAIKILRKYNIVSKKSIIIDDNIQKELFKNIIDNLDLCKKDVYNLNLNIQHIYSLFNINNKLNLTLKMKTYKNIIRKIIKQYTDKKKEHNYLDFDDLQILFLKFLKKSDIFKNIIKYVLVDEYQDINQIQYDIIKEFTCNITVVGDDAQSIYSFRGSNIKYILDFQKDYTNSKIIYLNRNYRNPPEVVELSSNIIKKNINQFDKKIIAMKKNRNNIKVIGFQNKIKEAKFICKKLKQPYLDHAILSRTHKYLTIIELELLKQNIPYHISKGSHLLDKEHVKEFLSYLYILVNPDSMIHWKYIFQDINVTDDILSFILKSDNISHTFMNIKKKKFAHIQYVYNQLISTYNNIYLCISILSKFIKDRIKRKYNSYYTRICDIDNLVQYILDTDNIKLFLDNINFTDDNDMQNKVILSTIHASKGLEWKYVYLVGTNNIPCRLSVANEHQIDEERRLFYVACTRAMSRLILTLSYDDNIYYDKIYTSQTSIFINEIESKLIQTKNIKQNNIVKHGVLDNIIHSLLNSEGPSQINKSMSKIRFFKKKIYQPYHQLNTNLNDLNIFFRLFIKKIICDINNSKIINSIKIQKKEPYYSNYMNNKYPDVLMDIIHLSMSKTDNILNILKYKKKLDILERNIKKIMKKVKDIYFDVNIQIKSIHTSLYIIVNDIILDIYVSRNNIKNYYNIAKWVTQIHMARTKYKISKFYFINPLEGELYKINCNKLKEIILPLN